MVVAEAAGDDMLGTRARRGVVAAALPDMSGDIAAHAVVHQGGRVGERLFQIDDGGQSVEIDRDVGERILGEVAALRQHHGQRLADVTDSCPWRAAPGCAD